MIRLKWGHQGESLQEEETRTHRQAAICKPREKASGETKPSYTLILDV